MGDAQTLLKRHLQVSRTGAGAAHLVRIHCRYDVDSTNTDAIGPACR